MDTDKTKNQITQKDRKPADKFKQTSEPVQKDPYYYELLIFDVIQKKSCLNGS